MIGSRDCAYVGVKLCVHEQKERCMYILVALQPFVLRLLCGAGLALLELA